jgi:uncharacterized protein
MKYLLIFLLVVVIAWRWRAARTTQQLEKQKKRNTANTATEMLACKHCGIHIPASDAVDGELGVYCSAAHRRQLEP